MGTPLRLEDYDSVVADIYEAALVPSHWDVALTNMVNRFSRDRWDVAMLVWECVAPPSGRFVGASGVHMMARQGYLHAFIGRNEWSVRGHGLPLGAILHSDQLVARDEFRRGDFYRQFLSLYNYEVGLLAMIDRSGDHHLAMCLPGPDNGATHDMQAALALLLPHIQRSVRISRRIGEAELTAASARAVLDHAPGAVLMCDAGLNVVYANAAGERLLSAGYFGARPGRVTLPSRDEMARLQALADSAPSRPCAAFLLAGEGRPTVSAMAMRLEVPNSDFATARLMIVAGRDQRMDFGAVDALKDWFGLTPAEARLAVVLAEGGTLEDFAAMRGITTNAARFLLKGVFAKTDTHRQGELVARLRSTPLDWQTANSLRELSHPSA